MSISKYNINRKHKVNHEYFDKIDSEEKAYWIGFLWADGSLSKTSKRCLEKNRLAVAQTTKDINQLIMLKKALNSDSIIKTKTVNNNYAKEKSISTLTINSTYLCKTLEAHGMSKKETRTDIPKMPKTLIRHFIRGYFDGDGCLSIYEQHVCKYTINRQEFSLTGNEPLLLKIQSIFEENTNVSKNIQIKNYKRTKKAVSLRYGGKVSVQAIFEYLYKNATVYNENKYNKFIEFSSKQSKGL